MLTIWVAVFAGGLIVGVTAICRAVMRAGVAGPPLRLAALASRLITLAMVGMLAVTLAWGLLIQAGAPTLFPAYAGQWALVVALMTAATLMAGVALWRGRASAQVPVA